MILNTAKKNKILRYKIDPKRLDDIRLRLRKTQPDFAEYLWISHATLTKIYDTGLCWINVVNKIEKKCAVPINFFSPHWEEDITD